MAEKDYKQLAKEMGIPENDVPVEEKEQPDDVAEIEEVMY